MYASVYSSIHVICSLIQGHHHNPFSAVKYIVYTVTVAAFTPIDTDVHVACLTCYGAVVSIYPALPEVQRWLEERKGGPWLVEHCTTLLKGGGEQIDCA